MTPQSPDRNAAADVLAAMRRYNSNPQQTIALDLAIRALRAGEANSACPTCKAPSVRTVNPRGGEWGWGTTDEERATYRYAAPPAAQPERAVDDAMVERFCQSYYNTPEDQSWPDEFSATSQRAIRTATARALTAALNPEAV
jgi:hypothetical protein